MGQKTHPNGQRVGFFKPHESRWFATRDYQKFLEEDYRIRKFIETKYKSAAIARVEIERFAQRVKINLHTARPGIIIGRRGVGVEELRKAVEKLTARTVGQININVAEVKRPELEAKLVGERVAEQLEKRVAFRRAIKQAAMQAMKAGAKGVRIEVSGRLAGAEIARSERTQQGKVPLHTLRADIDFYVSEAYTTFGRIGVKVWIYRGDTTLPEKIREIKGETTANAYAKAG